MNYIEAIAEAIKGHLPSAQRPDERADELYRLYAVLALTTGEQTSLENVHDAWSAWMSPQDPRHESLRPFEQLDAATREEDQPYVEAIRRVARER